jgi:hypothetical protein
VIQRKMLWGMSLVEFLYLPFLTSVMRRGQNAVIGRAGALYLNMLRWRAIQTR